MKIGDLVYYGGFSFEQNAGIRYAVDAGIPWYAVDIPLLDIILGYDFLRFQGTTYSIVPSPIGKDELKKPPFRTILVSSKEEKDDGYNPFPKLGGQNHEISRNIYTARAAEKDIRIIRAQEISVHLRRRPS